MVGISSVYARKAIAQAHPSLDRERLHRIVGLDPDGTPDLSQMVSEDEYCSLFEALAEPEGNKIGFHIRTGASITCDDLGAVGLAWKSSRTLADGFTRAGRYVTLLVRPRLMEAEVGDKSTTVVFKRTTGAKRLGAQLSNEASFMTMTSICREASQRNFSAERVLCAHPQIGDVEALTAQLGCPVDFEAGRNAMVISNDELNQPNALGDAAISQFFETHLDAELAKLPGETGLDQRVRLQVSQSLSAGVPTTTEIASRLGMSGRTLQRRLSENGLSFQTLVDEARRQLAEKLLQQTDYSLAEISFLTGFSEQSAFTRAFKRWSGQTPRSFRLAVLG